MHTKIAFTLALVGLGLQASAMNYTETCTKIKLVAPDTRHTCYAIKGHCDNDKGGVNNNALVNVGNCYGNRNGRLVLRKGGYFYNSCTDITFSDGILSASCPNNAGTFVPTSINTAQSITNVDGNLQCFGTNGLNACNA